jgi:DNA-binding transcriptional MerR regulator/DNA gyrase inhibitor GyrI
MDLYSIGEFSRMSGLPVKTLRFYHERGLLAPAVVEVDTGYRYYDAQNLETAQIIVALRGLDFSLDLITEILAGRQDDASILDYLEQKKHQLQEQIQQRNDIVQSLDAIIAQENQAREIIMQSEYDIEIKTTPPVIVGGIRMKGRYTDCPKVYKKLGRLVGRHIRGKAMMLCYDDEFREDDADFEPCMPLKRLVEKEGVKVRELKGGRCVTLIHAGPYEELTRSYGRIFEYIKEHNLKYSIPSREVYLKGPGMIFKGNPEKYLTEIQFMLDG